MIRIENLRKTYTVGDIEVPALREVSFSIERGDFVAIMGPSGSGKSTLMNIIGCLDRPSGGRYLLDGVDVSGMSTNELAEIRNRKIGFVFQSFNLLPKTSALENVELPLFYDRYQHIDDHRGAATRALERVSLSDRLDHHPSQLSGGQKQRVAIARALVNEPYIILADEPTGNLDSTTSIDIITLFQKLNDHGITVVLVTHETEIARYTKRILELRDGTVVRDERVEKRNQNKNKPVGIVEAGR
ncbi:MAG: ABC transporter ATP-binding protein [Spirochaetes bacterium]|nr:ABC transporter ATP-binding protein [Spirochaetota bacterium]